MDFYLITGFNHFNKNFLMNLIRGFSIHDFIRRFLNEISLIRLF